ncbi:MAG: long-chain fatty acid--CoA ligase [Deltaproteobacteria bacterium]|nr:long-chain fatty acid--CoA ligase [Deltaproteobacteria bacterium]
MSNLAAFLVTNAKRHPGKKAVVFNDKATTYAELNAISNMVANGLKAAGIQPGDRVALTCPNLPYFPMIYYGILKAGGVVVPLNVLLKGREIAYHLQDSGAKAYFCFQGTAELPMGQQGHEGFKATDTCKHFWILPALPGSPSPIEGVPTFDAFLKGQAPMGDLCAVNSNDTAVILYTSGTTGQPKGAELTHANLGFNAMSCVDLFQSKPQDIHLVALPLFHSFGQVCQMNAGIIAGNTLVLMARFDPAGALGLMEKENVTMFAGVPTMYWAMLNLPDAEKNFNLKKITDTLRLGVSGGSSMPVEVLKGFEKKFNISILEGYGLSETSPVATFNSLDLPAKPGSVGTAIRGVEVAVVGQDGKPVPVNEVGEVVIRGHNVTKGYINRPEQTREAIQNGWFHSGDLGKMDDEGYLYIVDRLKDMVLRGGFNVYPREVEEVLMTHPAVSMAAVVGVPHQEMGEEVKAYVILKPGAKTQPEEIISWSKEQMASYKYPRMVEIRDSLPMNATGKILKRELRG